MPRSFRICAPSADLAPLLRARSVGAGIALVRDGRDRHAGGAVAQIDDDAAAFRLEARQRGADRLGAAEHVADHVGAMQPRRHVLAVADVAIDEGHVMHVVERRDVGIALAACRSRTPAGNSPTRSTSFSRALAIGDQIGDRDLRRACASRRRPRPAARASRCRRRSSVRTARRPAAGRRACRDRRRLRYGRSASARRPRARPAETHGRGARNRPRRYCRWRARARCWCAPRPRCRWSGRA